jgi:8-oxo-dGTP diphosphatase
MTANSRTEWDDVPLFGSQPADMRAVVRPSAYGLVVNGAARIAIVRTPLGLYLPGGGMEQGESPIETVVREVWEECGLEAQVGGWIARAVDIVYSPSDRTHFEKRSTFVDARCSERRAAGQEPDHALEWVTPEEALDSLAHPSHRWAVSEWLDWRRDRA